MATSYLVQAAKGEDFWGWFNDEAEGIRSLGQETRTAESYIPSMAQVGHLLHSETIRNTRTQHLAINVLQGARGPFRLAVMNQPVFKTAHAIACYMGLKIRFLDVSGGGEFEFDSRDEAMAWISHHVFQSRVRGIGSEVANLSYAEAFPELTVYGFQRNL